MPRLNLESQVPAQYDRASFTSIVRAICAQVNLDSEGRIAGRYTALTSYPTAGDWAKGDIVWNSEPDSGDHLGWVCVSAGTPGTWAGFGAVNRSRKNALTNGAFFVNQRAAATNADDTYSHDRWYVLTQTNTIAVSTLSDVENGLPRMARLTQSQGTAQRMGYAQIIEGKDCKHLRGKEVTFRFRRVRISASQAVRYAVLEWTGTEDSVTSDVVNDWTSADYTDGASKFFVDTSFTPSGTTSHTPAAATLTDGPSLTVTLGSTFNNLVVLAWTEGTAAQNVTLDLGEAQIEQGGTATEFERRLIAEEFALCQRYHERGVMNLLQSAASANAIGQNVSFAVQKRVAPTMTGTGSGHANVSGGTADLGTVDGFRGHFTVTVIDTTNNAILTWTATAEL